MARPLRIQFPNAHYHVAFRGNAHEETLRSEKPLGSRLALTPFSHRTRLLARSFPLEYPAPHWTRALNGGIQWLEE
jgi:hypothetical protein